MQTAVPTWHSLTLQEREQQRIQKKAERIRAKRLSPKMQNDYEDTDFDDGLDLPDDESAILLLSTPGRVAPQTPAMAASSSASASSASSPAAAMNMTPDARSAGHSYALHALRVSMATRIQRWSRRQQFVKCLRAPSVSMAADRVVHSSCAKADSTLSHSRLWRQRMEGLVTQLAEQSAEASKDDTVENLRLENEFLRLQVGAYEGDRHAWF